MYTRNKKVIKISVIAGITSVITFVSGYSILNKDVTLVVEGKEKSISTFKNTVKELLEEQEVKYDSDDIISESLDNKLSDGDEIEIINVSKEIIKENKEVSFDTKVVEDSSLLKGKTKKEVEGKNGQNELIYTVVYHNGKQVEKTFEEEKVVVEPIDELIKKGTKEEVKVVASRGESTREDKKETNTVSSNREHMSVVATAYHTGTITATGTKPRWGTIAVDPKVIPYGTKVYIPQFDKTFIAEDTGGAIKGNKIDIFMNDGTSTKNWGRRTIDIYIIK